MADHPREADRVPLPRPDYRRPSNLGSGMVDYYSAMTVRAYADTCVAAAVAQERERIANLATAWALTRSEDQGCVALRDFAQAICKDPQ